MLLSAVSPYVLAGEGSLRKFNLDLEDEAARSLEPKSICAA